MSFSSAPRWSQKKFSKYVQNPHVFSKKSVFSKFSKWSDKCFQTVSIQEKIIKIDRTHYKRKLLSPKFFSKNQNWILKSRPKFSNFQKMAILRKWKYPIFVPKVHKITIFLSKCPENNFKTFHFDGFLRFFDIFLKLKKKQGKKSGQNHKKYKIETIFDVNFERFKMVFEKYSREEISSFYYSFSISYSTPKSWNETWESSLLQKEVFCKKCWFVAKIQQMLQKNFPTILWYGYFH